MKHVVAIIQARMSSTRLPGKVLMDIEGKPMLWHVVNRLKKSQLIDKIVIATTVSKRDLLVLRFAEENGIDCFAGSEEDVLDRYYQAAREFKADPIVRITGDCPLIDPLIVDQVVEEFLKLKDYDLVGTNDTFPDGLDTVVYSFWALEKAWREAKLPSEREHVGPYITKHPELFKTKSLSYRINLSHLRWTVDEEEDLTLVREIFKRLFHEGEMFYTEDILSLLEQEPHLLEINSRIIRNEGYLKSLAQDNEYLRRIDAKTK